MRKTLILFIIIVVCSLSVFASKDYQNFGRDGFDLTDSSGIFDSSLQGSEVTVSSVIMTDPRFSPLVSDLDGDGLQEIVVYDSPNIKILEADPLIVASSKLVGTDNFPPYIYDWDGDGNKEIIIVNNVGDVKSYEFNGSSLNIESDYSANWSGAGKVENEGVIGCGGVDECVIVGTNSIVNDNVVAMKFNSSAMSGVLSVDFRAGGNGGFCFPSTPFLAVEDIDNDGVMEYIFSMIYNGGGGSLTLGLLDQDIAIVYMNANDGVPTMKGSVINTEMGNIIGGITCAGSSPLSHRLFTSPTVVDIDDDPSNLETLIGVNVDADEFKIYSYNNLFGVIDDYPELNQADGTLLSNVFIGNFFTDTNTDFCVLGSQTSGLDLLCASEGLNEFFGLGNAAEFVFSGYLSHNLSQGRPMDSVWASSAHAVQHSQLRTNGVDLDEVINSFGIFSLDYDTFRLTQQYGQPVAESVVLSVDFEGIGSDDLIFLTANNLFYHNDQYENLQGQITQYEINPCFEGSWITNTTVSASFIVSDVNNDRVSAKTIFYEGETFEQDTGWSDNVSSGTTFNFNFVANQTGNNYKMSILGRDTNNSDDSPDKISFSYTVSDDGVFEFGDCISSNSFDLITGEDDLVDEEDVILPTDPTLSDNAITNAVNTFLGMTGLGSLIIWLIVMVVVGYGVWVQSSVQTSATFGIILLLEAFLLIIGSLLGFISLGIIITVVLISIAIAVLFIWQKIVSPRSE